jgi:hypothetical protein
VASPSRFFILPLLVLATLTGVTFVHGMWTGRWASHLDEQKTVAELEKMPLTVGPWQGKTVQQNTDSPLKDTTTSIVRRYVNQDNGSVATILVTRGLPGPMVIKHLPTECYVSSGYEIVGQPKRFQVVVDNRSGTQQPRQVKTEQKAQTEKQPSKLDSAPSDEFWYATFKKPTAAIPEVVRVFWSWSPNGQWQTPDRPRLTFAGYSTLYKLYVIQQLSNENEDMDSSSVQEFIARFTQELRQSFFVPAKS